MLPRSALRHGALQHELNKERAAALGRAGRAVSQALEALGNAPEGSDAQYVTLLYSAANAVWRYFVQREAVGIHNHDPAIEAYSIPKKVLNLVGARQP